MTITTIETYSKTKIDELLGNKPEIQIGNSIYNTTLSQYEYFSTDSKLSIFSFKSQTATDRWVSITIPIIGSSFTKNYEFSNENITVNYDAISGFTITVSGIDVTTPMEYAVFI